MMLCILKDLGSDSRHKLYKKFCRAEKSAMKVYMTGATELLRRKRDQSGIRVSALVRSTSHASRLEGLGIDVVRGHLSDKIMTITKAQQVEGFAPGISLSD